MRLKVLVLAFLAVSFPVFAQNANVIHGPGSPLLQSPVPNCNLNRVYIDDLQGTVYTASGFPCAWSSAAVHLTAQTATLGATTAYTNNTGSLVMVRASCTAHTTVAGSAGTVLCSILTPDSFAANSGTVDLTSLNSSRSTNYTMLLPAGGTVRYTTTVAGATGSPQYELVINIEILPQ